MSILRPILTCLALCLPPMAQAHPHIFVDTTLRILTDDQGRATGVEVTWAYDEFYSLLVLEDMQLDSDYDGVLTQAELGRLHGFDMQWIEGFQGDLYVNAPDGALTLGAPAPLATLFENGKIITRHLRQLPAPQETVVLRAYDPTFYTAYDLVGGVQAPKGCQVIRSEADLDAAYAKVAKMMDERAYAEDDYPEVGDAFADTVTVTCASGS